MTGVIVDRMLFTQEVATLASGAACPELVEDADDVAHSFDSGVATDGLTSAEQQYGPWMPTNREWELLEG